MLHCRALYWHILNLANYNELRLFLKQSEIEDIDVVFSASLKTATSKVKLNAEVVLQALEELLADELIEISRTVALNGPVGGLRKLASFIGDENKDQSQQESEDEMDCYLGSKPPSSKVAFTPVICQFISNYDKQQQFDDNIEYIFNLLKVSYKVIHKGIPTQQNTERDLDANYYWHMFSCLNTIAAVH
ncbi:hypothetical protein HDU78_010453 [Chytriomyces hyalinus]|nr:hypothetical protein HDU78_010453 [Chytriomyces hyalinus]